MRRSWSLKEDEVRDALRYWLKHKHGVQERVEVSLRAEVDDRTRCTHFSVTMRESLHQPEKPQTDYAEALKELVSAQWMYPAGDRGRSNAIEAAIVALAPELAELDIEQRYAKVCKP